MCVQRKNTQRTLSQLVYLELRIIYKPCVSVTRHWSLCSCNKPFVAISLKVSWIHELNPQINCVFVFVSSFGGWTYLLWLLCWFQFCLSSSPLQRRMEVCVWGQKWCRVWSNKSGQINAVLISLHHFQGGLSLSVGLSWVLHQTP